MGFELKRGDFLVNPLMTYFEVGRNIFSYFHDLNIISFRILIFYYK